MTSPTICIDANIIVRLVAPSPEIDVRPRWDAWQDAGATLVAPALLRYEVVNSFHRMWLFGNVGDSLADELLKTALSVPMTLFDENWLFNDALEFARHFNVKAAYDSHYLALSKHLGCDFWTTDKKFHNAVHEECPWVHLIESS